MIRIIHVSDLHFHRDNDDNQETLSLLRKIRDTYAFTPDENSYLLVTGDIVDDGDPQQYQRAFDALTPFSGRILLAPGNHDYGILGNLYSNDCAHEFDSKFSGLWDKCSFYDKKPIDCILSDREGTNVLAVGLNSVLKTHTILDFARGGIGEDQLRQLNTVLSRPEHANKVKIVYLHHRPQKCNWFLELTDSEDLMAIAHQNNVAILAFGHSGGEMRSEEPPQARIMNVMTRTYGVRYLLNANSSVDAQRYYEIEIDNNNIGVRIL